MSCITVIGRRRYVDDGCDDKFQWSRPEWTKSKAKRLEDMALNSKPEMRAVAAAHPRIRDGLLWGLLEDESIVVRRAAVKNPKLNRRMRSLAAQDEDAGIRAYVALLEDALEL